MAFKRKTGTGDGEVFKFENPGTTLTGVYVGRSDYQGDWGPTIKHQVKTEAGLKVIFGSKVLNDLLTDAELGKLIRITQVKSKPSKKGNPTKMYEVDVDDTYEMDGAELSSYAGDGEEEETDIDADAPAYDETVAARPAAPRQAANVGAAQAAKAQALLNGRRSS